MNYSEKIYDLRRKEDISQEALAAIVGTTRQQVSRWECGSAVPNPKYSYALAAHFGCTVEELYGEKVEEEAKEEQADVIKDTSAFHFGNKTALISIFAIINSFLTVFLVSLVHIVRDFVLSANWRDFDPDGVHYKETKVNTDYRTFMLDSNKIITAWVIISSVALLLFLIVLFGRYLKRTKNKIARSDLYNPFIAALTFIVSSFMSGLMFSTLLTNYESGYDGFLMTILYSLLCLVISIYVADLFITFIRMIFRPLLKKVFILTPWDGDIKTMEIVHVSIGIPLFIVALFGATYIVSNPISLAFIYPIILCYAYVIYVVVALLVHFLYCYRPFGNKKSK